MSRKPKEGKAKDTGEQKKSKPTKLVLNDRGFVSAQDGYNFMRGKFGEARVHTGARMLEDRPRIPLGIFPFDFASGGGIPIYARTMFWGQECVDGSSRIMVKTTDSATGEKHTSKSTTMRRLYERFHNICGGKGRYPRQETLNAVYTVPSVNEDGAIFHNRVLDVVHAGEKECFRVTLSNGFSLIAGVNHEFKMEDGSFRKLSQLKLSDRVMIHNNTPYRGRKEERVNRKEVLVKYHPSWPVKMVNGCTYYRGRVSRAIIEAEMNGITFADFITFLNTGLKEDIEKILLLSSAMHVHHKNANPLDNSRDNLEVMLGSIHNTNHALANLSKLSFIAVPVEIISIEDVGIRDCYDLVCPYPYNNYVVEGFVVHNSGGKTSGLLSACAMAQRICFRCFEMKEHCVCKNKSPLEKKAALIDIETDLDKVWAECIGVSTKDLIIMEPDTAEQASSMALLALQMEEVGIVGFDSIGAMGTLAELTREMEEQEVGSQAKVMTKFVRKMLKVMQRRQQANLPIAFLWINQMRHKIGVMFGTPEHYPGGWAVRHANTFVAQFKRITHKEGDKDKYTDTENSLMTAMRHSVSLQKHKIAILQGHCEFVRIEQDLPDMGLKKGQINDYMTTATKAVEMGIIDTKSRKLQDQWKEEPLVYAKFKMDLIKEAKKRASNRG